jgi:hypothetical protein
MNSKLFNVEIMPLEEFLRLSPWERIRKNDEVVNRLLSIEAFIEKLEHGVIFIKSHHAHPR